MATFDPNSIADYSGLRTKLAQTLRTAPTGSNLEVGKDTGHLVRIKNMQGKRKYQNTVNGRDTRPSTHASDPAAKTALDISAGIPHKNALGGENEYGSAGEVWGDPGESQ